MLLFADDITIFIQGQSPIDINNILTAKLSHISNWIKSNKLTLNATKTSYKVSCSLMIQPPYMDVCIDNLIIEQVGDYTFLGVIIDDKIKMGISYIRGDY